MFLVKMLLLVFECHTTNAPSSCTGLQVCAACNPLQNRRVSSVVNASSLSTAEVVISYCTSDINWLPSLLDGIAATHLRLARVTTYMKCGLSSSFIPAVRSLLARRQVRDESVRAYFTTLPNVGRCDHTWAHHVARYYSSLASIVLFMKDTTFSNPSRRNAALTLPSSAVLHDVMQYGFGCFRKPSVDGLNGTLHSRKLVMSRRQPAYRGHTSNYTNYRGAAQNFKAPWRMPTFVKQVFDPWFLSHLGKQSFIPVCYGGSFAFRGLAAQYHSRHSFVKLRSLLSRADNIEEGHYMERLWSATLQLLPSFTAQETNALTRGRTINGGAYRGLIVTCCCDG